MYSVAEIPPSYLPWFEWFNPAFAWFAGFEQMVDGQYPSTQYLWMTLAWTTGACVSGFFIFLLKERKFAARL
jgi:ABC-type polysaccharide/polyol phosphate export permease